jgi:hypothetical protein
MSMDWIVHPVLQSGLLMAGLVLCFYLFFGLQRETRQTALRFEKQWQTHEACLEELRRAIEEARSEFRRFEKEADVRIEPPPVVSGLNTSRRRQALRLHCRGESPRQIAAALSLSRSEVELLLKIEKLAGEDS